MRHILAEPPNPKQRKRLNHEIKGQTLNPKPIPASFPEEVESKTVASRRPAKAGEAERGTCRMFLLPVLPKV